MTDSAVDVAQCWRLRDQLQQREHPRVVRVVCRYPFGEPADGPAWVIESLDVFSRFERVPESTLRALYALDGEL